MEALQGLHLADTWRSSRMAHRGKHRSAETIHSCVGAMPSATHPKQANLCDASKVDFSTTKHTSVARPKQK